MIIYSISVVLDPSILDKWYQWITETHIPEVLATGYFEKAYLMELLDPENDEGWSTFNIQYESLTMDNLKSYLEFKAPELRKHQEALFGEHIHAFRTVLTRKAIFNPNR